MYNKLFLVHINFGDNMERKLYEKIVMNHKPKEHRTRNAFVAFIIGGLMGILGHFLLQLYSYYLNISSGDAAVFMIITLIFLSSLFTALGFFDKLVNFCRCGLIIPITGFAHSMTSAAIEFKREGYVTGLGANVFKLAGTVILYGIVSAYIFGIIRYLVLGGV